MIEIKSEREIARMRVPCGMAAVLRERLLQMVEPGITTGDMEDVAVRLIKDFGARSAFKGYHGFPGVVCISIENEVVHGIPGARVIQSGDVVSVDVGVVYDGFVGDCAASVIAGDEHDEEKVRLLKVTSRALDAAIEKAVHGARLGDVSHAVEVTAKADGFSIVREFVGHGIGRELHEEPQIPNFGPAGKGPKLKSGMTLAIEPMINMGSRKVEVLDDNWTVRTKDLKPSAHFENTILVRKEVAEILTKPENAKI